MFEIRLDRKASAYVRRLDPGMQQRIVETLALISADPDGTHSKLLTNAGGRRSARVGDYRIVYSVDHGEQLVNVRTIGPRGRVYRDL